MARDVVVCNVGDRLVVFFFAQILYHHGQQARRGAHIGEEGNFNREINYLDSCHGRRRFWAQSDGRTLLLRRRRWL